MATISNSNSNTLVVGTAEDDRIYNDNSDNVTIDGGAGNDSIDTSKGSNVSINGGDGNDSISQKIVGNASILTFDGGAGNDYIINLTGSLVTINGGADNDSIANSSSYVTIGGGTGDDSIVNLDSMVAISGGDGNDSIINLDDSVTIDGNAGNDLITQNGDSVTIDGGDGNDSIVSAGSYTSISGGAGDDFIPNSAGNIRISGEYGTVSASFSGLGGMGFVTINGGIGNDQIGLPLYAGNNVIQYTEGDGNDSVWGYSDSNSLQINSSVGWSSVVSGNNVVVTVGDGSITLVDAASLYGGGTDNTDTDNNVTDNTDTDTDNTVMDNTVTDNNVTDNTVTDNTVTDNTVTDNTVTDNNVTDNNVTDNNVTDNNVTDTPVTPETLPPAVGGAAYDIVFFVDVSGSMETYINQVNAIAQTFVDKLKERGITDYRLAVVDYETAFTVYFGADGSPFTQDVDTFKSWMAQAAEKSKQHLGNENALYAINHVLNNFPFNPTANKEFIVLTDEDFYDGQTFDLDVTEQSMAANGVQLDVIGKVDGSCDSVWTPVARKTGGNFYDINGNYTETFNEIVLNLDCVNVNLATVPDGQTGWFFVVPNNHVTDMKSVDAVFVNAADPNIETYAQVFPVVGMVSADKVYSGDMSIYRQNITIPDGWNVTGTSHADILNVAGTGFGVVIASGDGHDAVKLGDAATGIILTDHSLDDDGLEFARRQTLGTFTENVATDPVTMTNQVALTSPTMTVYLQDFSSPLQEEFDAKNAQFMAYGVTNGGTTNTVYDLLFGTEPVPEPEPEPIAPPQPPILNDTLMGRIMFAQWGYGFTPPEGNPLYDATTDATTETTASTIATDSLATSADLAVDFGSPSLDEIAPVNFAVTQDDFTAKNFTPAAFMQAYELSSASKPKFS